MQSKKLLTVKEFGKLYGVCERKAYRIANHPTFPKIKSGNKILIIASEIDNWLAKNIGLEV